MPFSFVDVGTKGAKKYPTVLRAARNVYDYVVSRAVQEMKLKQQMKDPTNTKRKMKKKSETMKPQDPAQAKEMKKFQNDADFITREAKRKRKLSKIRSFNEDDTVPVSFKKKSKKSSFDSELTNTSTKNVKKFRHVANKKKSDDRRSQRKGKNVKSKSSFK